MKKLLVFLIILVFFIPTAATGIEWEDRLLALPYFENYLTWNSDSKKWALWVHFNIGKDLMRLETECDNINDCVDKIYELYNDIRGVAK